MSLAKLLKVASHPLRKGELRQKKNPPDESERVLKVETFLFNENQLEELGKITSFALPGT